MFEAAEFVLLSHSGFIGNQRYWTSILGDPDSTPVRRRIAARLAAVDKLVVSDRLRAADFAGWENTRVIPRGEAYETIGAIKRETGGDIVVFVSRLMWNDLLQHGLVDELHLTVFPVIAGDGIKIFSAQPQMPVRLIESRVLPGGGKVLLRYGVDQRAVA